MTKMNVPFFRPSIGDAECNAVVAAMRSGWLTTGPNATAFEAEFQEVMGQGSHAVAVNSATAALHLALDALRVGPKDEVIVPVLTFTATAEVVRYMGATPIFVDIDPSTLCLSIEKVEAAISSRTKVIMPVHFAGRACDMKALRKLADKHHLFIVDDAAHALPTKHQGSLIGSLRAGADITAFSFYANKTMTTGEGGMIVTGDADLATRARKMRLHGIDRDVFDRFTNVSASWVYDVVDAGYKYNLTDPAAALGRVQLARIPEFTESRNRLAATYDSALADLPLVLPPRPAPGDTHSWHLYLVQVLESSPIDRNALIAGLNERGIGTSVHYRPLHQMTYWKRFISDEASFEAADAYFERCVSLPLFMDMTENEQTYVIMALHELLVK